MEQIPRPEHPRPDFERQQWLNLNGTWAFDFDRDDIGVSDQWYLPDRHTFQKEITVPFPWESSLSGIVEASQFRDFYAEDDNPFTPIGWYCRSFLIPESWRGKRIWMKCGAAFWETTVWVNGKPAGTHSNGYLPFEFDITDLLHIRGENCIAIRVFTPGDIGKVPHGKNGRYWYARISGIWQTVYLEPRQGNHITSIRITPCASLQKVEFRIGVLCHEVKTVFRVHLVIKAPDGAMAEFCQGVSLTQGRSEVVMEADISNPYLWEPDAPHLYMTTVDLFSGNHLVDSVKTYFGMRKVERRVLPQVDSEYLHLNDRPVYIKGIMNQLFHPEGLYSYPDEEGMKQDINIAKSLGFNLMRLHVQVADPRFLYWADKLGMMLWCEPPNLLGNIYTAHPIEEDSILCEDTSNVKLSVLSKLAFEHTLVQMVLRDYSHPSIILWACFIETWGIGGGESYRTNQRDQEWVQSLYHRLKSLDDTRLVIDNSASFHDHVTTDINDFHLFINDYSAAYEFTNTVINEFCRNALQGSGHNFVPGYTQKGQPLICSSTGVELPADSIHTAFGFRLIVNELRLRKQISGYVFVQLTDVAWELNGMVTFSREAKEFGYEPSDLNTDAFVALQHKLSKTYRQNENCIMDVYFCNYASVKYDTLLLKWGLTGIDQDGNTRKHLLSGECTVSVPELGVAKIGDISFVVPGERMSGMVIVQVEDNVGRVVAKNFILLEMLPLRIQSASETFHQTKNRFVVDLNFDTHFAKAFWDGGDDRIMVDGVCEAIYGIGSGFFEFNVSAPPAIDIGGIESVYLQFEASSKGHSWLKRNQSSHPTEVTLLLNEEELGLIVLDDELTGLNGILSAVNGIGSGAYGYVNTIEVPVKLVSGIDRFRIRFEVKKEAQYVGGMMLFGARLGRYPFGPSLIFQNK